MRIIRYGLFSLAWAIFLGHSWRELPAIGPLLEIHSGVWHHKPFVWTDHALKGLVHGVHVAIDKNGVPHLFAESEADLYLAQGYVMASQRLFQIDATSRSMSGHLGELVGGKGRGLDDFYTTFGMRQAERALHDQMMSDPKTSMMANQFVRGLNAYIAEIEDLPVEYKLLGAKPQAMDAHVISRMAKTMTFSLSGSSNDLLLTHLAQQMPIGKILDLFPEYLPPEYEDFIFSGLGGKARREPESEKQFTFKTHLKNLPAVPRPPQFNGSNNWVVGPKKSATGHSILANDTHLGLSLPNVWFETQLSCPEFNIYGASFPAIPGLVNGFNKDIAWGPTNGATDALDYYEVEFADESSVRYRDGTKWLEARIEVEPVSNKDVRVTFTKWGPVLYREGKYGLVANWTGYRPSNELAVLRRLYSGRTARECMDTFKGWQVPIQNFACADADHIGMIHAGWVAHRNIGEGRFVQSPEQSWSQLRERVPPQDQPQFYDPPEGYLRSANQRVMGPNYPYYMGWNYSEPFRAKAIRHRLEAKEKLSGQDLIDIQNDSYSLEAAMVLPLLLKQVNTKSLTAEQNERLKDLAGWDFNMRSVDSRGALYKQWFQEFKAAVFSDEINLPERPGFAPKDIRVAWMLARVSANPLDSDAEWIDDKRTPERETLSQIATQSYLSAWDKLTKTLGQDSRQWSWRNWIHVEIPHLAKIPGFGSPVLDMDGSSDSARGNRGWHGAVYKMVVELGEPVRAWIQIPGGNSGDPLDRTFERFTREWAHGEMREVEFYADLSEAKRRAVQIFELTPREEK